MDPKSFQELSTMPMVCYGCGLPMRHLSILNALHGGKTLREVMDELGYQRICCRKVIQAQPSLLKLQKQLANNQYIDQRLAALTLESTAPNYRATTHVGGLQIIDEAPPMEMPLFFSDGGQFGIDGGDIDPFEYFVNQNEAPDDEESPF